MMQDYDKQSAYHKVPCSAIVFYGVSASPEQFAAFCDSAVEWSTQLGYPPDQVAIEADGFTGKYVGFPRAYSKLKKIGFESATSISFRDVRDGMYEIQNGGAYVSLGIQGLNSCLVATKCEIATLEDLCSSSILKSILGNLSPLYGIGYVRPRQTVIGYGYGSGLFSTLELIGPKYEAERREQKWMKVMRRPQLLQQGFLRHVLPVNFLREVHLEKPINGITLRDWIAADSSRGSLTPVEAQDDPMHIWRVEESQLENLEAELAIAGIIFNPDVHLPSESV